jgi:hypothetical protein
MNEFNKGQLTGALYLLFGFAIGFVLVMVTH